MERDNTATGNDSHLVARIVSSYVRHNRIGVGELPGLIAGVHLSLSGLGPEAPPAEALVPAVSVRRSVHRDFVICLDCGFRSQMLRRHLMRAHRLTPAEYRARWQLASDHPITAPSYSAHRSELAKLRGLGRKDAEATRPEIADAPPAESGGPDPATTTSPPKRRGRPRRSQPAT